MSTETFGSYQLLRRLAMGGMAELFLARELDDDGREKLLVVKRILPHLAENEEFVRMFLDEARIAARLNHPNIVQIFDLGAHESKEGTSYFIAMEHIHGENLRAIWRVAEQTGKGIPVHIVCQIIIEACQGLEYAHRRTDLDGKPLGIVHRDISPQNILVAFDGRVKIVDFGIAKAADRTTLTKSGVLKGKYPYMSPEQADALKVDRRSDVFALGIVFHEMLTGSRLFKRATDYQTLDAVLECQVSSPSEVNPRAPKSLDPVVMRALKKDPVHRYQDARAFKLAIEEWLQAHEKRPSQTDISEYVCGLFPMKSEEDPAAVPPDDPGPLARRGTSSVVAEQMSGEDPAADEQLEPERAAPVVLESILLHKQEAADSERTRAVTQTKRVDAVEVTEPRASPDADTQPAARRYVEPAPAQTSRRLVPAVAATVLLAAFAVWLWLALNAPKKPMPTPEQLEATAVVTATLPAPAVVERKPLYGTVRFVAEPWAEVRCDNRPLGMNNELVGLTPSDKRLPVGTYECRFRHPELGIRAKKVEVKRDALATVSVTF